MKKKIYLNSCLIALFAIIITCVLTLVVCYQAFDMQTQRDLKSDGKYVASALNNLSSNEEFLSTISRLDSRITLVAQDGTVLFDNEADYSQMGNHIDRPEIIKAFQDGESEDVRVSETLGSQTFYYALRLDDNSVLRMAKTTSSVFGAFVNIFPIIVLIAVVVFLLVLFVTRHLTRRLVAPINNIDLHSPQSDSAVYDELAPLIHRITMQNKQISEQIYQMQQRQAEFHIITENMTEGLILLDQNMTVLSANKSAIKMLDAMSGEYSGKNLIVLTRNLDILDGVRTALSGRHHDRVIDLNGTKCQIFANPVYEAGKVSGIVLFLLDVSEREKAEAIRREFSANVSHELKTPLTSISGYAELMENGMVQKNDIPVFAAKIHKEATRLITLVQDIIKISQLDENDISLPKEKISLSKIAKNVLDTLETQLKEKNIHASIEGSAPIIHAVPQLIHELLFNLCDNAIKYNNPGGSLTIRLGQQNGEAVCSVSDDGIGIEQEHLDRIFERFYRVDKSHSRATGGTGLGLSIVKHIAEYHGGRVTVQSRKNAGTMITVYFPLA